LLKKTDTENLNFGAMEDCGLIACGVVPSNSIILPGTYEDVNFISLILFLS